MTSRLVIILTHFWNTWLKVELYWVGDDYLRCSKVCSLAGSKKRHEAEMLLLADILKPIMKFTNKDNWFMWVNKDSGKFTFPYFEALDAYWPGLLVN